MSSIRMIRIAFTVGIFALWISCSTEETVKTQRGFPYVFHIDNPGPVPEVGEYAYFHITMRAGDSVLNSSYQMDQLPRLRIPGPEEYTDETSPIIDGLALMSIGDSMTLHFPLDSLEARPPAFAQYDMIDYDLVMKEIKSDAAFKEEMQAVMDEREAMRKEVQGRQDEVAALAKESLAAYKSGSIEGLQKLDNGLEYVIHEPGEGRQAREGSFASVQYYGMLVENGQVFDHSFAEGTPYSFPIGQGRAIQGWDIGIPLLKEGGRASLFIPYELGYGATGYQDIPPKAQLYFYVELQELN